MGVFDPITFARASTGRFFNFAGLVDVAAVDVPRRDHLPSPVAPVGVLLEGAATNLVLRSQEFDNAYWGREPAVPVPVPVADLAPDGSATAFRIVEAATNTRHWVGRSGLTFAANGWHTVSVFARAATRSHIGVVIGESGGSFRRIGSIVNLTDGSVTPWNNGTVAEFIRHPPQALPGGWWRIAVSVRIDATATSGMVEVWPSSGAGVSTYLGNGASGVLVWGIQCEAGLRPTSYIPTAASTVTRAADDATVAGSGWLTSAAGTLVIDGVVPVLDLGNAVAQLDGGARDASPYLRMNLDNLRRLRLLTPGATIGVDLLTAAAPSPWPGAFRAALRYNGSTIAICLNGGAVASAPVTGWPGGLTRLMLGDGAFFSSPSRNIRISRARFWQSALSNADLQALTA